MNPLRIGRLVVGLTIAGCAVVPAEAAWRSLGPDGGSVNALAVDPRDGRALIAATPVGLFRSANSGHSWQPFGAKLAGWTGDIAFDPFNPRTLLAATAQGMFRSPDAGQTWGPSSTGLPQQVDWSKVRPSRNRRGIVLAIGYYTCGGGSSVLVRSNDGGVTWSVVNSFLPSSMQWLDLREDLANPDVVYLASNGGLYRSRDGGRSWKLYSLPGLVVSGVLPDVLRPPRLWAVAENSSYSRSRVLLSTDGGLHWQERGGINHGPSFYSPTLALDPARRDHLYLGTPGGLLLTEDAGRSWRKVFDGFVTTLVGDRASGTLTAAGFNADFGVARSQNGVNWVTFDRGLRSQSVTVVVGGGAALWASSASRQWVSQDDGNTWAQMSSAVGPILYADPSSPSVAYAGSPRGLYRTLDGGVSWQYAGPQAAPEVSVPVIALVGAPSNSSGLYLLDSAGIHYSGDGANSWRLLWTHATSEPLPNLIAVAPGAPPVLFAGYGGTSGLPYNIPITNISRSTDDGVTWSHLASLLYVSSIVTDPADGQRLWAALPGVYCYIAGGVSRSVDGGATWAVVNPSDVYGLALDPRNPNLLFAASDAGILMSRDSGATFQVPAAGALTYARPTGVALRLGAAEELFAATRGGVYALTLDSVRRSDQ